MIRVLVLGALLLLLQFLRTITLPGTDRPGVEPMTLAAVGFVVLAAFTVGELGGRAKLPGSSSARTWPTGSRRAWSRT